MNGYNEKEDVVRSYGMHFEGAGVLGNNQKDQPGSCEDAREGIRLAVESIAQTSLQ